MGKKKTKETINWIQILILILFTIAIITGYIEIEFEEKDVTQTTANAVNKISFDLESIPEYTKDPYVIINNNMPNFTKEEIITKVFETYSELDSLGRCGVAYANICMELMPTGARGAIASVKPSGWKNKSYPGLVDGDYIYNRCHLIGYQLAGENANEKNLITGTRYMNVEGMLPFEDMVDDYIEQNEKNHVLYRVTPVFKDNNLVASGVQMEAYSVEDNGKGVCYNIYVYNVQPGIKINYLTGESELEK